jgi:hypothetical protein
MFGFKKNKERSVDTRDEILLAFSDEVVKNIKTKILDEAVAMGQRSMTEVLEAKDSIDLLLRQKTALENEVDKLKSKARLEEAEFKGLMKLREDRLSLDLEQKAVELEKEHTAKEMALLKDSHTTQLRAIEEQSKRLDMFMEKVMDKLTYIREFIGKPAVHSETTAKDEG